MKSNKKNIAICFWGQTRTFRTLENTYKTLKHKDINFDYFVSTWDDFKDKSKFKNFTKKEFIKPDILNFKNHTDRALYCIHRVNNLKTQNELDKGFIYDYIFWVRSEIEFETKYLLEYFLNKLKNNDPLEVNTHSGIRYEQGLCRLDADYYFGGTSLAFDLFASGWKYYFRSKNSDDLQGPTGGHHAHAFIIEKFNLKNIVYKIHHEFLINKLKKREV